MAESPYLVGIDLGTSNCAVAYVEPARGPDGPVLDLPIPQLHRMGEVVPGSLLPSCLYITGDHELPAEATRLPWGDSEDLIVGEFARWQGSRVPGRLISSAKSWLCHPGVDRSADILPWGAAADLKRISPVRASSLLLRHMARAWEWAHPEVALADQEIIITVPASFDEVARALTVNAATGAGLVKFSLLEEPQAAFYDFTARHRGHLAEALAGVRLVLVVDVGGGTSDFTLVQAALTPEGPVLRRLAVGDHLILGGDNMDAALARKAEERMAGGRKVTAIQWTQLTQAARLAKETLLGASAPERYHLSLAAEGSRLIGGSLSVHLERAEAEQLILDGFFPRCEPHHRPERAARVALQEIGLPYAHDPAITRHLAAFLQAHASAGFAALGDAFQPSPSALPRPDAILLNGGVFNSPQITARLLQVLSRWWPDAPPIRLLEHGSLELSVARGAAYYGLVRRGLGRRITGGTAHALYVGLEKAGASAPAALCLVPRGHEEGEQVDLGRRDFQLTLGRPVRFPLFSSTSDRIESPGDVVPVTEDMKALPPIHTVLKSANAKSGSAPVHLRAHLTEIGTLELWCVSNASNEQWRLEFELRGSAPQDTVTVTEAASPRLAEARQTIEGVFGTKFAGRATASSPNLNPAKEAKALWSNLEKVLGARETWRVPTLRELWSTLLAGAPRRRRSLDHERVYFQLLGYCLRPGFGYPLDEWRCEQTARLFVEGLQFNKEKPVWTEFWVLWRRIAGGLSETRHAEIWTALKPHLAHRVPPKVPKHLPKPKGVQPEGLDEMIRLGGALEHVEPLEKALLGDWIAARLLESPGTGGAPIWALGRLGARVPIYGSVHKVVDPGKAAEWTERLLASTQVHCDGALFAATQLARLAGDRTRDLPEDLRNRVRAALQEARAPASWFRMLSDVVTMEASDKAQALGDSLPVGLQLA